MNEKLTQLWDDCLAVIKDNVDIDVFDTWFAPIEPIRYQQCTYHSCAQPILLRVP